MGYSLDTHVVSSIPTGEDPYGNMTFATVRSEIGEELYQYKYQHRIENLGNIVDTIVDFLNGHPEMRDFESIIPVPPTPDNNRSYQPTHEIAKSVAERIQVYFCDSVLEKKSGIQLKGLTLEEKKKLGNFIEKKRSATRKHSVLLIDDLFQSGTTLNNCSQRLREDPLVNKIYVLAVTKTKNS